MSTPGRPHTPNDAERLCARDCRSSAPALSSVSREERTMIVTPIGVVPPVSFATSFGLRAAVRGGALLAKPMRRNPRSVSVSSSF